MRMGKVFKNIPTIDSIPVKLGGRPETVAPNTMSDSLL